MKVRMNAADETWKPPWWGAGDERELEIVETVDAGWKCKVRFTDSPAQGDIRVIRRNQFVVLEED